MARTADAPCSATPGNDSAYVASTACTSASSPSRPASSATLTSSSLAHSSATVPAACSTAAACASMLSSVPPMLPAAAASRSSSCRSGSRCAASGTSASPPGARSSARSIPHARSSTVGRPQCACSSGLSVSNSPRWPASWTSDGTVARFQSAVHACLATPRCAGPCFPSTYASCATSPVWPVASFILSLWRVRFTTAPAACSATPGSAPPWRTSARCSSCSSRGPAASRSCSPICADCECTMRHACSTWRSGTPDPSAAAASSAAFACSISFVSTVSDAESPCCLAVITDRCEGAPVKERCSSKRTLTACVSSRAIVRGARSSSASISDDPDDTDIESSEVRRTECDES
mmetsp:Transcript_570/g.1372  ORF Transcript_570/g.1372 Transcript_570/m.1372 type:complete len:350 (+) Transcript_570:1280-2329(+)